MACDIGHVEGWDLHEVHGLDDILTVIAQEERAVAQG